MIYFNHSLTLIVKNSFYRLNMVHPNGKVKSCTMLGDGIESAVRNLQSGGYYIKELELLK